MGTMLTAKAIQEIIEDEFWTLGDPDDKMSGWFELEELLDNKFEWHGKYEDPQFTRHEEFQPVDIARIGKVTLVERVGGGEGDGEHQHLVIRVQVSDGSDRLFRIDGRYVSFAYDDEYEWADGHLYEVQEKQKVITVYE